MTCVHRSARVSLSGNCSNDRKCLMSNRASFKREVKQASETNKPLGLRGNDKRQETIIPNAMAAEKQTH